MPYTPKPKHPRTNAALPPVFRCPPTLSQGACRDHPDPDIFSSPIDSDIQKAKAICGQCPVRWDCLLWGIQVGDDWCIFGGFTAPERRIARQELHEEATQ